MRSPKIVVQTESSGEACGYPFENGKSYLVYANRESKGGPFIVKFGSRTALLEDAIEDLVRLGSPKYNNKTKNAIPWE